MIRAPLMLMTLLAAAPAAAQSITISTVQVAGREGIDESATVPHPINIEECAADAEVSFRVSNIPTAQNTLVFYRGGAGETCNQVTLRDGEGTDCEHLASLDVDISNRSMIDFTFVASDLVDCVNDENDDIDFAIFLLAMESPGTADVADRWGSFELGVDRERPPAPTDVRAGSGDTQIEVRWDYAESGESLRRFEIWVDDGMAMAIPTDGGGGDAGPVSDAGPLTDAGPAVDAGDAGGVDGGMDAGPTDAGPATMDGGPATMGDALASPTCGSTGFVPGGVFPADQSPTACTSNTGGGSGSTCPSETSRSFDLNPADFGLGFGATAAVTVVAVDESENRSEIGSIACMTRVETIGLCDSVACEGGCQCSAPGAPSDRPAGAALVAVALVAGLHYRRRRRSLG